MICLIDFSFMEWNSSYLPVKIVSVPMGPRDALDGRTTGTERGAATVGLGLAIQPAPPFDPGAGRDPVALPGPGAGVALQWRSIKAKRRLRWLMHPSPARHR